MTTAGLIIGIDESGKGDFFGPLVVAGLACAPSEEKQLAALGARDSKKIADKRLLTVDEELRAAFPHVIVVLSPEEYNVRYESIKNLNKLLADLHAEVIARLATESGAVRAISDKFGKTELIEQALEERQCTLPLKQLVRGEAIPQVAAASVLARAAFIREMQALSDTVGLPLPKGAAPQVDEAGRELVRRHGVEMLRRVAKLHFKNYHRVVNPRLAI